MAPPVSLAGCRQVHAIGVLRSPCSAVAAKVALLGWCRKEGGHGRESGALSRVRRCPRRTAMRKQPDAVGKAPFFDRRGRGRAAARRFGAAGGSGAVGPAHLFARTGPRAAPIAQPPQRLDHAARQIRDVQRQPPGRGRSARRERLPRLTLSPNPAARRSPANFARLITSAIRGPEAAPHRGHGDGSALEGRLRGSSKRSLLQSFRVVPRRAPAARFGAHRVVYIAH
jgi:hypothetical protein